VLALLALTAYLACPLAVGNRWSVELLRAGSLTPLRLPEGSSAPTGHNRATLWKTLDLTNAKDYARALELAEAALARDPENPMLRTVLARAYREQGRLAEAASEWARAGNRLELFRTIERALQERRWPDALGLLDNAPAAESEAATLYRARAVAGQSNPTAALGVVNEALQTWPTSSFRQRWLLARGEYLRQVRQWPEAMESCEEARGADGSYAWQAHICLGKALYSAGAGRDAAIREFTTAVSLRPDQSDGYLAIADVLRGEHRYTEADDWYAKAAAANRRERWLVVRRADSLLEAGNIDLAISVLEQAIALFPAEAHFYYQLGQANERHGSVQLALAAAKRSVALDRLNSSVYRQALARLYATAGSTSEAAELYEQILATEPGNTEARRELDHLFTPN
jgi:tetratricopeptide (TPR) repeat protein